MIFLFFLLIQNRKIFDDESSTEVHTTHRTIKIISLHAEPDLKITNFEGHLRLMSVPLDMVGLMQRVELKPVGYKLFKLKFADGLYICTREREHANGRVKLCEDGTAFKIKFLNDMVQIKSSIGLCLAAGKYDPIRRGNFIVEVSCKSSHFYSHYLNRPIDYFYNDLQHSENYLWQMNDVMHQNEFVDRTEIGEDLSTDSEMTAENYADDELYHE